MNKERRKRIDQVVARLIESKGILEDIKSQEEEAYGNLPESFKFVDKADEMQVYIADIEEAKYCLDKAINAIR